jgi:hypothetical protein
MGWRDVNQEPPAIDAQVWVAYRFADGERGQGYAIYDGAGEWFFDVTEDGDLLSRSHALKMGLAVAVVTHWMELPSLP